MQNGKKYNLEKVDYVRDLMIMSDDDVGFDGEDKGILSNKGLRNLLCVKSHHWRYELEFCILPSTRSRLSQDSLNL